MAHVNINAQQYTYMHIHLIRLELCIILNIIAEEKKHNECEHAMMILALFPGSREPGYKVMMIPE